MLARQEARRGRRGEGRELTTGFGLALAGALQPRCRTDPGRHVWSPARPQATLLPPLDADPGAHPRGPAAHVAAPLGPPGGRGAPREVAQAPPAPRRFPGSTLDREAASPRPPAAPAAPPLPARDLQAGARPATAVPPSRPGRKSTEEAGPPRGRKVAGLHAQVACASPSPPAGDLPGRRTSGRARAARRLCRRRWGFARAPTWRPRTRAEAAGPAPARSPRRPGPSDGTARGRAQASDFLETAAVSGLGL